MSSGQVLRLVFVQPAAPRNTSVGQRNKACSQNVGLAPSHPHSTQPGVLGGTPQVGDPHQGSSHVQALPRRQAPGPDPQTGLPADGAAKRQKGRGGSFCFVSDTLQLLPSYPSTPGTLGRIWGAVTPSLLCCEFLPLTAHPKSWLLTQGRERPQPLRLRLCLSGAPEGNQPLRRQQRQLPPAHSLPSCSCLPSPDTTFLALAPPIPHPHHEKGMKTLKHSNTPLLPAFICLSAKAFFTLLGPGEGSHGAASHGNLLYYNCSLTIPAVTIFSLQHSFH